MLYKSQNVLIIMDRIDWIILRSDEYVAKLLNTFAIFLYFPKYGIMATKVFTFNNEGKPGSGEQSSATLDSATDHGSLPDHFLICSSHSQQLIHTPSPNTKTVYVLYEDSNFTKPWFFIRKVRDVRRQIISTYVLL